METTRFLVIVTLMALCWMTVERTGAVASSPPGSGSRLPPCPDSPNCVSSESTREGQAIAPLAFQGSPVEAFACLKRVVMAMPRAKLISSDAEFIHAQFRTRLGFVDDVSFALDENRGAIHMRSASRVGYWDLGVNRRRLEKIRQVFGIHCP
jgi:uncharacterized protein (DUF1499 family)